MRDAAGFAALVRATVAETGRLDYLLSPWLSERLWRAMYGATRRRVRRRAAA